MVCLLTSVGVKRLPAQDSATSVPTIKTNVRQVLVPAVVTGKNGRPVSNLEESDFTVFEDDVPQHIAAFSKTYDPSLEISSPPVARGSTPSSKPVSPARIGPDSPTRTYLVCVDTLHSNLGNVAEARHALKKFFEHEHDAKAQYALMNLSRQIDVVQDSTRDPSLVLSALGSKKFQSSILHGEASSIAADGETLRRMLERFSPEACKLPVTRERGTVPDYCSDMKRETQLFITKSAERTALLTRAFLQEMKTIISVMAAMPTQRTLILISDGFNLVPGRELFGIASAYFPDDPEWRFNQRDTQSELDELLRLAQKDSVIVYALDSRGLYTPASTGLGDPSHRGNGDWTHNNQMIDMMKNEDTIAWENGSAMAQLAAATGGIYFENNNDLLAGIRRAFDDERERYLIAYTPSNESADGKYRKIRVTVKDKNLRVDAKAGYWATAN
jgi:VWFA-related protein